MEWTEVCHHTNVITLLPLSIETCKERPQMAKIHSIVKIDMIDKKW